MLPDIPNKTGATKIPLQQFAGLERRVGAGNGTICDMQNLTGADAPVLASRTKRWTMTSVAAPHGLYGGGYDLFYVDGKKLYQKSAGSQAPVLRSSNLPAGTAVDRVFAALGTRLVIWPDKVVVDMTDSSAPAALEASYTATGLVFSDGTYAGETAEKNSVTTTGSAFPFHVGDAVTIPACAPTGNVEKTAIVREISANGKTLRFYENTFEATGTVSASLTLRRSVPDLDYICANGNRVWGCKDDTIWCSKLGDPYNWNVFDGLSTDAWSIDTGTQGAFTGCISFMGYPVFFKENSVFKVYGNRPTNYEVMPSATLGVLPGAAGTMAVAGETLYYLSRAGFVRYNGGYPSAVDGALNTRYKGGGAGSDGSMYYVSAVREDDTVEFLVFDPATGQWYRQDTLAAKWFGMYWDHKLVALTTNKLLGISDYPDADDDGFTFEADFAGSVTFADFDLQTFGSKYPVRLWLRMQNAAAATVTISYNGGSWEAAATIPAGTKTARYIPVPIRRCDRFGVKIETTGAWKLFAMEIETRAEKTNRKGG